MDLDKENISHDHASMLSARKAARLLKCAPDYIGKLCREGKLEGVRVKNAWFVSKESIKQFEEIREIAKAQRASSLAQIRRQEIETYRKQQNISAPVTPQENRSSDQSMLSARKAARLLKCAPDYIGKLCREGKLEGVRVKNAWFVSKESIKQFEEIREIAKAQRASSLAQIRREENKTYRKQNGIAAVPKRKLGILSSGTLAFGTAFVLLLGVFVSANAAPGSFLQRNLAAAIGEVDSPFFGTAPLQINLSSNSFTIPSFLSALADAKDFFSGFFAYLATEHAPVALGPSIPEASTTPVLPIVLPPSPTQPITLPPVSSQVPNPTIIQNATYPVIERTVVQSGITQDDLTAQLQAMANSLRQEIYANVAGTPSIPYSGGGFTNSIAVTNNIDKLNGVALSNVTINGVNSDLSVSGDTSLGASLSVAGNTSLAGTLSVTGLTTLTNATTSELTTTGPTYLALNSGNTQIATTTAQSTLAVAGNASIGADYGVAAPTNGLIVEGNVGIGTTTPFTNLTVQGSGYFSGNLTAANFTATGTASLLTASTSQLSVFQKAYFGATATSTFDSLGDLALNGTFSQTPAPRTASTSSAAPFLFTGAADTGLTGEAPDIQFNDAQTKTFANSTIPMQRAFLINAPIESFASYAPTNGFTDLATLAVTGAPITAANGNGTTTNAHTLYLGSSTLNASTTNSYGLTVNANTGAQNNYAAEFLGGNVGIGTTSPFSTLSVAGNGYFSGNLTASGTLSVTGQTTLITASTTQLTVSGDTWLAASGGNVGIGTTTQQSELAVAGNVSIGTDYNVAAPQNGLIVEGNVGIGTTSPYALLSLATSTNAYSVFTNTTQNRSAVVGVIDGFNAGINTLNGGDIVFQKNGTEVFRTSGTNVGIGTSSPYAKLTIWGSDTSSRSPAFTIANSASTTLVTVMDNGNVGIGTSTPDAPVTTYINSLPIHADILGTNQAAGYALDVSTPSGAPPSGAIQANSEFFLINYQNGGAGISNNFNTFRMMAELGPNTVDNYTAQIGAGNFQTINDATTTLNRAFGVSGLIVNKNTGTTTNGLALWAASPQGTTGNITNAIGLEIDAQKTSIVTNAYGIYQGGASDNNYFAGNIGIATTSPFSTLSIVGNEFLGGNLTATGTLSVTGQTTLTTASATQLNVTGQTTLTTASTTQLTVSGDTWLAANAGSGVVIGSTGVPFAGLVVSSSTSNANGALGAMNPLAVFTGGNTNNRLEFGVDNSGATAVSFLQSRNTVTGSAYLSLNPAGGNVGIGTTSPFTTLAVAGNGYLSGNLTSAGNTTLGTNSGNTVTVNALISSSLQPNQNITYDIGSPSFYWRTGYFNNLNVNSISAASTSISGTVSSTFTINTGNNTSDTENSSLIFFRGTVNPNAVLTWNSTAKRFEFNQPVFIQNNSTSTGNVVTLNLEGLAGQTADLFDVASSTGAMDFNVTAAGNVGIGTSSPFTTLAIAGNEFLGGNLTATGTLSVTGQTTLTTASTTQLTVSGDTWLAANAGSGVVIGSTGVPFAGLVVSSSTSNANGALGAMNPLAVFTGGNTNNRLEFGVDNSGATTVSFLQSRNTVSGAQYLSLNPAGGNVGIGTTHPTNDLTIDTSATGTEGIGLISKAWGGNLSINPNMFNGDDNPLVSTAGDSGIIFSSSAGEGTGNLVLAPWSTSPYGIRIQGANGYIGIDNATPAYSLDVSGFINTDQYSGYKQAGNTVLYASTTNQTLAVGDSAAPWANATSSVFRDVALGYQALTTTPTAGTAQDNTALGYQALENSTSGYENTGVGSGVMKDTTTGNNNTAVGYQALDNNLTGIQDTAAGAFALFYDQSATNTVAIGNSAGKGTAHYSDQGGAYLGYAAGHSVATGSDYNALFGYQSGYGVTTGADNVLLGASPDSASYNQLTTGSQNIAIGYDVALPSQTANGQLDIGNFIYGTGLTGTQSTVSNGMLGIGTTSPFTTLSVEGSGYFGGNLTATGTLTVSGQTTLINASTTELTVSGDTWLATTGSSKVGIGNTNPAYALDVTGTVRSTTYFYNSNTLANQIALNSAGANYGQIGNYGTGEWYLGYGTSQQTLGTEVLDWNSAGQVGIGSTSPSGVKVAIDGGALAVTNGDTGNGGSILLGSGAEQWKVLANDLIGRDLQFVTSGGTSVLSLLQSNNSVGVNNYDPQYTLDVGGFINTDQYSGYKQAGNTVLYASTTNATLAVGPLAASWANATSTLFADVAVGIGALNTSPTSNSATGNTAIGYNAIHADTTGHDNTALGWSALVSNTSGWGNTADSNRALYNNTTGSSNTAIGESALFNNISGSDNTANGLSALVNNTIGSNNTGVGLQSLGQNVTGDYNVAEGYNALYQNQSATDTVAIGALAAQGSAAYSNQGVTAIGFQAGVNFLTGSDYDTLLGYQSGFGITTGADNVLLGASPDSASYNQLTTGSQNIAIGYDVAVPSQTANGQLDIGNEIYGTGLTGTGATLSTGNIGIGNTSPAYKLDVAGYINTDQYSGYKQNGITDLYSSTTNQTVTVGQYAAPWANATSTAFFDTAVGYGALQTTPTTGLATNNTALGNAALTANTTGSNNTAEGYGALTSNTSGSNNTANGMYALIFNTSGTDNNATGFRALSDNTTGSWNTVDGFRAMYSNLTGSSNTAYGYQALYYNQSATNTVAVGFGAGQGTANYANQNGTYLGYTAGYSAQTGSSNNTLVGFQSGYGVTTGQENTFLGASTDAASYNQITAGNQNIAIGFDVAVPSQTANGQLDIGNEIYGTGLTGTGSTLSTGNIGIGTTTPQTKLDVEGGDLTVSRGGAANVGGTIDIGYGGYQWKLIGNQWSGGDLMFRNPGGQDVFYLSQTGEKVGIGTSTLGTVGTTTTNTSLTVQGNIYLSGNRSTIFTTGDNNIAHVGGLQMDTYDNGQHFILTPTLPTGTTENGTIDLGGFGNFNSNTVGLAVSGALNVSGQTTLTNASTTQLTVSNDAWLATTGGNVGIGTTNPVAKLDVQIQSSPQIDVLTGFNGGPFTTYRSGSGAWWHVGKDDSLNALVFSNGATPTTTENLVINSSGDVGIGTTTPNAKLTVNGEIATNSGGAPSGASGSTLSLFYDKTNDQGTIYSLNNGVAWKNLKFEANSFNFISGASTQGLYQNSSGRVGINNTSPAYTLDVSGYINTDQYSGYKQNGITVLYASTTSNGLAVGQNAAPWMNATSTNFTDVAVGQGALFTTPTNANAYENTAVGYNALRNNTSGDDSTALGTAALSTNTTGARNTALGSLALISNTTGARNIGIGFYAMQANTTGSSNDALGTQALFNNASATDTVAIGDSAAAGTATYSNQGGTYIGFESGTDAATGSNYNTAIGYLSLANGTTGAGNTVTGASALQHNSTGNNNTINGIDASFFNQSATNTVAIGGLAAEGNSFYSNQGSVVVGYDAGNQFQTGSDYNTLLGYQSGYGVTTGADNILLGASPSSASYNQLTSGSQNIAIGYNIALPSQTASGQLDIGNEIYGTSLTGTGSTLSTGNIGIGTTTPAQTLEVVGGGIRASGAAPHFELLDTTVTGDNINDQLVFYDGATAKKGLIGYQGTDDLKFQNNYSTGGIGFNVNASDEALYINSSGDVGIGSSSPAFPLSVNGGGYVNGVLQANEYVVNGTNGLTLLGSDQGAQLELHGTNGTSKPYFDIANGSNDYDFRYQLTPASNLLSISASSTPNILNLLGNGNVGIGTTNPGVKLDVNGTLGFQTTLYGNGKDIFDTADSYLRLNQSSQFTSGIWLGSSPLRLDTGLFAVGSQGGAGEVNISGTAGDGTNRITIDGNSGANSYFNTGGNVGIGTTTPYAKLDTNGVIRSTGYTAPTSGTGIELSYVSSGYGQLYTYNRDTSSYIDTILGTNGNQLDLKANGNIGIGTTSPQLALDIQTGGNAGDIRAGLTCSSNYSGINLNGLGSASDCNNYNILSSYADQNLYLNVPSGKTIFFRASNNNTASINSSGDLDVTGWGRFTSPNSGSTGAVIIKDAAGNTNTAYLQFVNNADNAEYANIHGLSSGALTINATNGVGINVAPSYPLDVNGIIRTSTTFYASTAAANSQIALNSSGADYGQIGTSASQNWYLGYGTSQTTVGAAALEWNNSGDVTVGGSAPSTSYVFESLKNGGTGGTDLGHFVSNDTWLSQIDIQNTSTNGRDWQLNAIGGSNTVSPVGDFVIRDATANQDRVRIDSAGNFGIDATPDKVLTVNGAADNTTGVWAVFSDARLKNVQGDFTDGLSTLLQFNPVTFYYNGQDGISDTTTLQHGIIAQDVQKFAPYMIDTVQGTLNGTTTTLLQFNSQALPYITINAIKQINGVYDSSYASTSQPTIQSFFQGTTTPALTVDAQGNVAIGTTTASSTPFASTFTVVGSGCFSQGAGATVACGNTPGNIYYKTANTGNYDVAENYQTTDTTLTPGTIVALDPSNAMMVTTATTSTNILGVVSTAPGLVLGGSDASSTAIHKVPVGLVGRVPVEVVLQGDSIAIGDRITLSPEPGIGMKAGPFDPSVGIALESAATSTGTTTITVFVNPQPGIQGPAIAALVASSSATSTVQTILNTFSSASTAFQQALSQALGGVQGLAQAGVREMGLAVHATVGVFNTLLAQTITADTVYAQKLCLGSTCITQSQLEALLAMASSTPTGTAATSTSTTTPLTLTVNGNNPATVTVGSTYIDLGATVSDGSYPNIGYVVSVDGGATTTQSSVVIDTSTAGSHTILYSATDPAGNTASATRIVDVVSGSTSTTTATSTPTTTSTTTASSTTPTTTATSTATSTTP